MRYVASVIKYEFMISKLPEIKWIPDPCLVLRDISTPTDKMLPLYKFQFLFNIAYPLRDNWLEEGIEFRTNEVVCFTDGSKTDDGTGCGIYCMAFLQVIILSE